MLRRSRWTVRRWMILTLLIGLLFSFEWKYQSPYCEARGIAGAYHPLAKCGVFITWAGEGFCEKYGPEVGIHYGDKTARIYRDRWNGGFQFYSR